MDLTPMCNRVIALDVHQVKITACAIVEHDDGRQEMVKRDFCAFKCNRRALANGPCRFGPRWWSWRGLGCTGRVRSRSWRP